jgi:hypothetical protein
MHTTLNPHIVRAFLIASASMLAAGAEAAPRFLPAQAGDLIAPHIVAPEATHKSAGAPGLAREAVAMSWAAQGPISTAAQTFAGQSREYYVEASADELNAGVAIHTTSPRALVRLQPLGGSGPRENLAIHPQSLILSDGGGAPSLRAAAWTCWSRPTS